MAQANAIAPARISVCAARFTRLDADGTPADPPKNGFVTCKIISVGMSPVITDADQKELAGGCDDIIATWETPPKFRGWTLTLSKGLIEPALEELIFGGDVILDDSTIPVPIGMQWPAGGTTPPPVAAEFWSKAVLEDHQPGPSDTGVVGRSYPYIRYVFPWTYWAPGDGTLDADLQPVGATASTRGNVNWGLGPWGDQPIASLSQGFYVYDDDIPDCSTNYVSSGS
jgi:hypothetical protein